MSFIYLAMRLRFYRTYTCSCSFLFIFFTQHHYIWSFEDNNPNHFAHRSMLIRKNTLPNTETSKPGSAFSSCHGTKWTNIIDLSEIVRTNIETDKTRGAEFCFVIHNGMWLAFFQYVAGIFFFSFVHVLAWRACVCTWHSAGLNSERLLAHYLCW